jgi:hypothetical protein
MSRGESAPARSGAGVAGGLSPVRGAAVLVTGLGLAVILSGCAQGDALALAKRACQHVDTSVSMYRSSQRDPGSAEASKEEADAVEQLRDALPLAAAATGEASQWQALMTTLSESTRLPESDLEYALESQCAAVAAGG